MLAGISHDLRTPLARLRLEAEMSVKDEEAKRNMAMDIDQLDAIIDKFMDYARPGEVRLVPVQRGQPRRARGGGVPRHRARSASPRRWRSTPRCWPTTSSSAACSRTCSRTRAATAAPPTPASPGCVVSYARTGPWVIISVRDHGQGVDPKKLDQLTTPFFRGDAARTAATGAGLGLAIVEKAVQRMGGAFELANAHRRRAAGAHPAEEGAERLRDAAQPFHVLAEPAGRRRAPSIDSPRPTGPMPLGRLGLDADLIDGARRARRRCAGASRRCAAPASAPGRSWSRRRCRPASRRP